MKRSLKRFGLSLWNSIDPKIKGQFISMILTGLVCIEVTLTEISLLPDDQKYLFIFVKLPLSFFYLMMAYWIYRQPKSNGRNFAVAAVFALYCIIGSLCRAFYFVALFEVLAILIVMFPLNRREFWLTIPTSIVLYLAIFWYRYPNVPELSQKLDLVDFMSISLQQFLILWMAYFFFVQAKDSELESEKRFGLIGRQAARVAHDLKGAVGTPLMYLESLTSKSLMDTENKELTLSLNIISTQIHHVQQTLEELSRLCSSDQLPSTRFYLSDAVNSVKSIFIKQLYDIEIITHGDILFECDRSLISSILSNLVSNSLNAFKINKIAKPQIEFLSSDSSIKKNAEGMIQFIYRDNAGGLSPDQLFLIANGQAFTTLGTGMGLKFIKQNIEKLGGTVEFQNHSNSAKGIEVKLCIDSKYATPIPREIPMSSEP